MLGKQSSDKRPQLKFTIEAVESTARLKSTASTAI